MYEISMFVVARFMCDKHNTHFHKYYDVLLSLGYPRIHIHRYILGQKIDSKQHITSRKMLKFELFMTQKLAKCTIFLQSPFSLDNYQEKNRNASPWHNLMPYILPLVLCIVDISSLSTAFIPVFNMNQPYIFSLKLPQRCAFMQV